MKIPIIAIVFLAIGSVGLRAQTANTAATQGNVPAPTDYQIIQQDGNSRVWQREIYEQEPNGQIIARPHQFTELATGLNYKDPSTGQWQPSKEEIDIQPDGTMSAIQGQHQVYFPGNIYGGEIELVTPNGVQLHSCPVGLSYDDGSNTVLIAVLTNSIGQLVGSNQVIYTNAFAGLNADLLFSYTKSGLEQDIVLREQPPIPASLNLSPETTRLQVLTEFFDPPQPGQTTGTLPEQAGLALTDDTLDFGTMQMIPGKAFMLGNDSPSARVGKSWVTLQGRQFLVEAVPVAALAEQLDALPAPSAQTTSTAKARVVSRNLMLPPQHLAKGGVQPLKLVRTGISPKPGVVLDYLTVNSSLTNYTFQGDTTYYISGYVELFGTNTFEGGAVLKYASGASINLLPLHSAAVLNCLSESYRPIVFTAIDDNSVGQTISGSTGTPSGYYANPTLQVVAGSTGLRMSNFRISYAQEALNGNGLVMVLSDAQFLNCQDGISVQDASLQLENDLFSGTQTNFVNPSYSYLTATVNVQNVTFNNSMYLAATGAVISAVVMNATNCIFANITNVENGVTLLNGQNNGFYDTTMFGTDQVTNDFYPFQTVGAGDYYLTNGCNFFNAGTPNIDPTLLADLQQKTTYPPVVIQETNITDDTVFTPQAQRDNTGTPDLGYHYDPIDYIFDDCSVSNAMLTLTNGVAVASYNEAGIELRDGSSIVSVGTPLSPNWFVRYSSVQEEAVSLEGTNANGVDILPAYSSVMPSGQFQFTKFACPADGGDHLYDSGTASYSNLLVQECEFWGGANYYGGTNSSVINLENNLFDRSVINASGTASLSFTNNLIWGTAAVWFDPSGGAVWNAFNNDFDSSTITNSVLTNGYNAYLNGSGYLVPTNATDIFSIDSLAYQMGYLGSFYQPTNSLLIGEGSTTANLVGLYHYTVTTNQVVEGTNIVSIGYHYVATDTNDIPLDTNGDGIPDYLEDANGNGLVDDGETNWAVAITSQPASLNATLGDDISFSVSTMGWTPTYGWYFNATNQLAGETNATLIMDDITTNDVGNYSVVVTADGGSITSSPAALTVQIPQYVVLNGNLTNLTFQSDTTYYVNTNVLLAGTTTVEGGTVIKFSTNGSMNIFGPLICKTGAYRPALFTAADDNSAGAGIDTSTGIPIGYYDASPINIYCSSNVIHDLRMTYLNYGLSFYTNNIELDNVQAVNCNNPITLNSANITINNGLFYDIGNVAVSVNSGTVWVNGTQLTAHDCATFANTAQLSLTNSLVVNATNLLSGGGTLATNSTVILTNDSGVFQTAAYGNHYLAGGSPYRNAGTTNLSLTVLANIANKTTYAPVVIEETDITTNMVFTPQVEHDNSGIPDLGYHYDPIDYAVGGVEFDETDFLVYPGTTIGTFGEVYGYYNEGGLMLGPGSIFLCEGMANDWNRIIACNTVQEEANTNWVTPSEGLVSDQTTFYHVDMIECRFTHFSVMAQDTSAINISEEAALYLRDCQFHGGTLSLTYNYAPGSSIDVKHPMYALDPAINNCLFERVNISLNIYDGSSSYFENNLLIGGDFNYQPQSGYAIVQNNLFEKTIIPDNSGSSEPYINGFNAYVTNFTELRPVSTNDVVLPDCLAFETGPMGSYYQPDDSPLIDAGSTNAASLGLYDYTVLTNLVDSQEIKETNGTVSIGYHYVAVDASGNPISTYTNGLPDYLVTSSTGPVPDWWEFVYFGNLDQPTNADYDSDGTNILTDYQNGIDPNIISFSLLLPNQYVSTNVISGSVSVLGGVPSYYAVLVGNTNFSGATWVAYTSSTIPINLGSTNGSHDVWVGLRGLPPNAQQTWENMTVVLDTVAPTIAITSPANNVSFNSSSVDISGNFSCVSLEQISINGMNALINGTNFEELNVPVGPGTNIITAIIQDKNGVTNTASIQVTGLTNSDGTMNQPVLLQATPVTGFAPLTVAFSIETNCPGTLESVSYDFNGDGIPDFATNNLNSLSYTYLTNGEFFPVVTIQTSVGQFSSVGGWNSADLNPSTPALEINVEPAFTETLFTNIVDPVALKLVGTNLYVLSGSSATITEFDLNGNNIRSYGSLGMNPSGFDVDSSGDVYVSITASNQVWKLDPTDNSFSMDPNFGSDGILGMTNAVAGTNDAQFDGPFGVALVNASINNTNIISASSFLLAVSDSGNDRVQLFLPYSGNFVGTFGSSGSGLGQLSSPEGLATDSAGILYIADSGNNRIVLAQNLNIVGTAGTNGTAQGEFDAPQNISVGDQGVYVADTGNNRIQKFAIMPNGQPFDITPFNLGFMISTNLDLPAAVVAANNLTNESFYVADTGNNRILFYTVAAGDPTVTWTNMVAHAIAGDFMGASQFFCSTSADKYEQSFLDLGASNTAAAIGQIGTLTPGYIYSDTAQYYFQQTVSGQSLTFTVDFIRENGVWKILEF